MAAGNSSNAIYYSISNGKICRQFNQAVEGSVSRVNKNGKTVHELFFDYLDGVITEIKVKDTDFGKFWSVTLMDGSDTQVLQFNYSGGYANGFLMALPNIDLSQNVKLVPKSEKVGDKTKTTLFANQGGNAVKWFWTKDNPGELPPLQKIKVKGKETWDDSAKMEFLEEYVRTKMLETYSAKHNAAPVSTADAEDDMPF